MQFLLACQVRRAHGHLMIQHDDYMTTRYIDLLSGKNKTHSKIPTETSTHKLANFQNTTN